MELQPELAVSIRPLTRADLDAVVAIDAALERRTRRAYIERRLAAALRAPAQHAQFAVTDAQGLAGYIAGRVLTGEFGRTAPSLRLELVGLRASVKGHGAGRQLLGALMAWGAQHGVHEVRTGARWNDFVVLHWLDAMGFELAPNHVLDCAVEGGAYRPERDAAVGAPEASGPSREIDYGAPATNDYERLARDAADVRTMLRGDLAEIARIDRGITGRDRTAYIGAKLGEALDDSAIRVSLTARCDGAIVGYLMAAVDLGDFGRLDPVAVIDTIGVDPEYAHRGIGHALVSQLFVNLGALHVERVETVVAPHDLPLAGFLYDVGFRPSQRLAFVRRIEA